jgi:hypothetical protein
MLIEILLLIIIVISLIIIILVLARKFPILSLIDIEKIPKERQEKIKKTLLQGHLRRRLENKKVKIKELLASLKKRLAYLEEKYRAEYRKLTKKRGEEG